MARQGDVVGELVVQTGRPCAGWDVAWGEGGSEWSQWLVELTDYGIINAEGVV